MKQDSTDQNITTQWRSGDDKERETILTSAHKSYRFQFEFHTSAAAIAATCGSIVPSSQAKKASQKRKHARNFPTEWYSAAIGMEAAENSEQLTFKHIL